MRPGQRAAKKACGFFCLLITYNFYSQLQYDNFSSALIHDLAEIMVSPPLILSLVAPLIVFIDCEAE